MIQIFWLVPISPENLKLEPLSIQYDMGLFPGIADINWMTGYGNLLGSYSRWTKLIHGHEGIFTDMKVYSRTWRYIYKLLCLSFVIVLSHCLCMMSFILYLWTRLIHGHEGIFLNLLSILLTICLLLYIIFA